MIKTYSEIRTAKDEELLACVDEFSKKKITAKEFKEAFGTDYEYTAIANELRARGYALIWAKKAPQEIKIKMESDTTRMNLSVTKDCKEKYEKYLKDKSCNYIHTSAALMHYMDDIKNGKITVLIDAT